MSLDTIQYAAILWDVEYDYTPPRPGVHTLRNGNPGYPDEPAELDITSISLNGSEIELLEFLSDSAYEGIAEVICNEEHDARAYPDDGPEEWL